VVDQPEEARHGGAGASDEEQSSGKVVALPIGGDIFRAQVIAAACAAEGLKVQLLTSEMAARPNTVGVEQQLLVRSEDVDTVQALIRRQG
jgi:hypothetical protein